VLSDLALPILDWFTVHQRDLPWRRTRDPYAIWISEIMLQQTRVQTVIPYWERWMTEFPDVPSLAAAHLPRVLKLWEGLGYYRRARHLHLAARQILESHQGRFPSRFADILALPGIGRYTAGAIASIAFDEPVPILDGNVIRVLARLQALQGSPAEARVRERLWEDAGRMVMAAHARRGPGSAGQFNQALMELGALICTPAAPSCPRCPALRACRAHALGAPENFPSPKDRPKLQVRYMVALVLRRGDQVWIRRRPETTVNGGFWEFPTLEVHSEDDSPALLQEQLLGTREPDPEPLMMVRHTIMHHRIIQKAYLLDLGPTARVPAAEGEWMGMDHTDAIPVTTAHRRILRRIQSARAAAGVAW